MTAAFDRNTGNLDGLNFGGIMLTDKRTNRRWIVSLLGAVADVAEPGAQGRTVKAPMVGQILWQPGQKGFALRLRPTTGRLSDAAR